MYSTHHPALAARREPPLLTQSQSHSESNPRITSESIPFAGIIPRPDLLPLQARPHALALAGFQFSFKHHHHPPTRHIPDYLQPSIVEETGQSASPSDSELEPNLVTEYQSDLHQSQPRNKELTSLSHRESEEFGRQTAGQLRRTRNSHERSLKRQYNLGEISAKGSLHAGPITESPAKSPKERWDAMMASSLEDNVETVDDLAAVVSSEGIAKEHTEEEDDATSTPETTPYLQRRSVSQPLVPQAPYPTPVTERVRRRVNTIADAKVVREVKSSPKVPKTSTHNDAVVASRPTLADEIAILIAASGSAEEALEKVVTEKRSLAARSEQLWQLVEKQRAMMLDLNKNLERALKEKDRYRLKLKESLGNNSSALTMTGMTGSDLRNGSVDLDATPGTPQNKRLDRIQVQASPHTPARVGVPPTTTRKPSNSTDDSPLSSHHRNESMLSEDSVTFMEATPVKISPLTRATAKNVSLPQSPQDVPPPRLMMSTSTAKDLLPQSKKGPPTPLDLSAKPTQKDVAFVQTSGFYSDSDYTASPSTPIERGRRRTRHEDENGRGVAEAQEAQRGASFDLETKSKAQFRDTSLAKLNKLTSVEDITLATIPTSATKSLPASPRPRPQPVMSRSDAGGTATIAYSLVAPLQSPGLPMSPRPIDRPLNAPVPRAPKTPLPIHTPLSDAFTMAGLPLSPKDPNRFLQLPSLGVDQPSFSMTVMDDVASMKSRSTSLGTEDVPLSLPNRDDDQSISSDHEAVHTALMSSDYPGLLLSPAALKMIQVRISCPSNTSQRDVLVTASQDQTDVFALDVIRRSDQRRLWTAEKLMSSLPNMHHSIKATCNLPAMLPQDSPFARELKFDPQLRQAALTQYFKALLETQFDETAALILCRYLSSNVLDNLANASPVTSDNDSAVAMGRLTSDIERKSGSLYEKSNTFGNWKSRYFTLDGALLTYYTEPGGEVLGSISLVNARIARERDPGSSDYKHVFLILESKKEGFSSSVKHVLCASSDEARDDWIEALLPHTIFQPSTKPHLPQTGNARHQPRKLSKAVPPAIDTRRLQTIGYESTIAAGAPFMGSPSQLPTPLRSPNLESSSSSNVTLGVPNAANVRGSSFDEVSQPTPTDTVQGKERKRGHSKKRSLFGFRTNKSEDHSVSSSHKHERSLSRHRPTASKAILSSKVVFGAPLAEAAKHFAPQNTNVFLPSPVFRCIEYLEYKQAALIKGIFRLSGASLAIKALKERFNNEGDVDLMHDGQQYDVHAVASLLKTYLRDLPENVLTQGMQLEFINAMDNPNSPARVMAVTSLVQRLPEANIELLATLTRFLIGICDKAELNQMNVRNISIVFAPTLNIAHELISLLLTSYSIIFKDPSFAKSVPPTPLSSKPSRAQLHTPPPTLFHTTSSPQLTTNSNDLNNPLYMSKYSPFQRPPQSPSLASPNGDRAFPGTPNHELDNNAVFSPSRAYGADEANRDTTIESLRWKRVAGRS